MSELGDDERSVPGGSGSVQSSPPPPPLGKSVLPTLTGGAPLISKTMRIERGEGDIAGPLGEIAKAYPLLSIGSYPFQKDGRYGAHIVIRGGDEAEVDAAMTKLGTAFP